LMFEFACFSSWIDGSIFLCVVSGQMTIR
jgi:hypothetical protein